MHRFFFLLIIWILVEAYWVVPQSKMPALDMTQTRSVKESCIEEFPLDSLEQKSKLEIMK